MAHERDANVERGVGVVRVDQSGSARAIHGLSGDVPRVDFRHAREVVRDG